MNLKINNSKEASIKSGKWKDPGAKLFDQLLNAAYFASDDVDDPRNENTWHYLREAYLVAPVKNIKYGPHGQTPYSRSGCKYPHHTIRNGELVVHEAGLKAAYSRAKQMGIFSGEIKEHLERHYKELGLYEGSTMQMDESMESNFGVIENYILETTGIDLYSPTNVFEEKSHGKLKSSFRKGLNIENGHIIKVVFDLDSIQINPDKITDPTKRQKLLHYVKKNGHNDFVGKGTVTAIIDEDNSQRLQSVKMIGIWSDDIFTIPKNIRREYDYNADRLSTYPLDVREKIVHEQKFNIKDSNGIMSISVGKEIDRPAFMATSNVKSLKAFADLIDYGTRLRQRGTPVKEYLKKKDLEYTDSILESEIFEERSHGNLKHSFRLGANIENGHKIKIVFDLNSRDVDILGNHNLQEYRNKEDDKSVIKNIRKTGHTDFSSKAIVKSIIDMDTNQKLNSVKVAGIIGDTGLAWDIDKKFREEFRSYIKNRNDHLLYMEWPVKFREKVAKECKLAPWAKPLTYTVGQEEKDYSYKSTVSAKSIMDLYTGMENFISNSKKLPPIRGVSGENHRKKLLQESIDLYQEAIDCMNDIDQYLLEKSHGIDKISFPKEEYQSIQKDLDRNGYCYTTRVSNEINKYKVGSSYETPWNEIIIIDNIKKYKKVSDHPFYNELTKAQIKLIYKYSEAINNPFAVLKFSRASGTKTFKGNSSTMDIYPLKRADVTSPYFVKWLFKTDEFCDDDPEKFDFDILVNNPAAGNFVYGYYVNNLEGIIRVKYRKDEDYYSITMLFVNAESEGSGIGQSLLKYAIDKFGHKEMRLNVFTFNKRAIHIYEKFGFGITNTITVKKEPGESEKFVGKKMYEMVRNSNNIPNIKSLFETINTPQDLMKWMNGNIQYGYIDGRTDTKVNNYNNDDFYRYYVLESPEQILVSRTANCFGQTEFERKWFQSKGINHRVFYIEDELVKDDCHSFLLYELNNKVFWFENSWKKYKGIHQFSTWKDALQNILNDFNQESNPSKNNAGAILFELNKIPNFGITYGEYIDWARKQNHEEGLKMEGVEYDDLSWVESYLMEEGEATPPAAQPAPQPAPKPEGKKESLPKQTDKAESDKNGVRRKKLYIAFIEWAKSINPKNTFGSVFDKDAFHTLYPFVPHELRYFYRLANPMLCVLQGDLTFFAVAELKKLNIKNSRLSEMMIFAATKEDVRVFNNKDKKVYRGAEENGMLKLAEVLGDTFDIYLQKMINQGDILNGPIEESVEILPELNDGGLA